MSAADEVRAIFGGVFVAITAFGLSLSTNRALWSQPAAHLPAGVALTDANFARYAKSSDELAAYIKAHPGTDMSATSKDYASPEDAAKDLCDKRPKVSAAIAKGGLTCAQYFALTIELEKAAAFASMFPLGKTPPTASATSVANLAFYRKHAAQAKRVLAEIGVSDEAQ